MNTTFKATKAQVWPLVKATFPEYKGRKFSIEFAEALTVHDLDYHDSSSKNEYVAVAVNGKMLPIKTDYAQFDPLEGKRIALTPSFVVVEHSFFCGTDAGITIWAHPVYAPKWLKEG